MRQASAFAIPNRCNLSTNSSSTRRSRPRSRRWASPRPRRSRPQAIPPLLDGRDVDRPGPHRLGQDARLRLPLVERFDPPCAASRRWCWCRRASWPSRSASVLEALAGRARLRLDAAVRRPLAAARRRRRCARGAQIVVGTPGRTLDHLRQGTLHLERRALPRPRRGRRDARPRLRAGRRAHPRPRRRRQRQTALFSATVPDWVTTTARKHLHRPGHRRGRPRARARRRRSSTSSTTSGPSEQARRAARRCSTRRGDGPMLVFGRTKHGVKKLAEQLAAAGLPGRGAAGQPEPERARAGHGRLPLRRACRSCSRPTSPRAASTSPASTRSSTTSCPSRPSCSPTASAAPGAWAARARRSRFSRPRTPRSGARSSARSAAACRTGSGRRATSPSTRARFRSRRRRRRRSSSRPRALSTRGASRQRPRPTTSARRTFTRRAAPSRRTPASRVDRPRACTLSRAPRPARPSRPAAQAEVAGPSRPKRRRWQPWRQRRTTSAS